MSTKEETVKKTTKTEKPIKYEFGGPVGTFFVVFGLPVLINMLYFLCNKDMCMSNPLEFDVQHFLTLLPKTLGSLFSYEATCMYIGWFAFHVFLERILPGESVDGTALPDGTKLKYPISGHLQFWITLMIIGLGIPIISLSNR